ncbi:hypothetical protein BZA77DRAFT_78884 [Pyronema omphalodes]|nr:hypothetical protein BZA77DRAFT_78884 [Pyronema omphalodes]
MATTTTETKRRSSFKNLFSLFKANKSEKSLPQPESAPPASFQLSYTPATSPSPSNSSASSFEFEDSTTTADTTPSNSRTSVVSKPSDVSITTISSGSSGGSGSSSISTTSSAATTVSSNSSIETPATTKSPTTSTTPTKSLPIKPRPTSLLNPAAAGCPYLLPPSPPASPILHTRATQPIQRRSSLGRFLPRGYRSNPDLSALDLENSSDGDLPISSSAPTSRPGSRPGSSHGITPSTSGLQKSTSKKKSKSNKRADLEAHTSYSPQERMEHRSILGADPAGLGFYLYPKPANGRPVSIGPGGYPAFGPVGAGGYPSFGPFPQQNQQQQNQQYSIGNMGRGRDSGRRAWREQKGRSYQRTIATSCIVEEEGELRQEGEQQENREQQNTREQQDIKEESEEDMVDEQAPTLPQLKVQSFDMPSIDSLLDKETGIQIPAMVTA